MCSARLNMGMKVMLVRRTVVVIGALTFRIHVHRLELLTLFRDFRKSMKMCKMNYFSLFCKSYLVLFLTFIMAFRFYAAPPQIQGFFGAVLAIFGVAFVRALVVKCIVAASGLIVASTHGLETTHCNRGLLIEPFCWAQNRNRSLCYVFFCSQRRILRLFFRTWFVGNLWTEGRYVPAADMSRNRFLNIVVLLHCGNNLTATD